MSSLDLRGITAVGTDNESERYFGVVYRGKAFGRITAEDYEEAIAELQEAKTQLEPDGDNCHVCHDSDRYWTRLKR